MELQFVHSTQIPQDEVVRRSLTPQRLAHARSRPPAASFVITQGSSEKSLILRFPSAIW